MYQLICHLKTIKVNMLKKEKKEEEKNSTSDSFQMTTTLTISRSLTGNFGDYVTHVSWQQCCTSTTIAYQTTNHLKNAQPPHSPLPSRVGVNSNSVSNPVSKLKIEFSSLQKKQFPYPTCTLCSWPANTVFPKECSLSPGISPTSHSHTICPVCTGGSLTDLHAAITKYCSFWHS